MEKTIFLSITDAEQESDIARAIVGREREVYAYELNIQGYEATLLEPDVTPAHKKRLNELLLTEYAEREKCLVSLRVMKNMIAPTSLQAAVDAAKAKLGS